VGEQIQETPPPAVAETSAQPLLAFVHIPRTGGGTLSSAISKNVGRMKSPGNFQTSPAKTKAGVESVISRPGSSKAVGDHVPFGLFRRVLPSDTRYVTVLRDPVDRVLSHYHFHAQSGNPPGSRGPEKLRRIWEQLLNNERTEHDGPQEVISLDADAEFTLEEGLRRRICIYDNFMTRFLWGGESLYGELPPDALDRAKENVAGFWFVGIRERLDESIILLGRKLGIGVMPYNLRHVSTRRPPLEETPQEVRELVAEYNALDVELYRFARERFEESAPPEGALDEEVEELRTRSAEVTEVMGAQKAAHKEGKRDRRLARKQARRAEGRTRLPEAKKVKPAAARETAAAKAERRGKKKSRQAQGTDTENHPGEAPGG
jgi:hypothetical protein